MKSTARCVAAVTLLCALNAPVALGYDAYADQILFRGEPNTTYQHWEYTTNQTTDIVPETYYNPYGIPECDIIGDGVEWRDDWEAPPELNPPGEPFPGFHCPNGATVIYLLHNDPTPRDTKIIIIQVTSSKEPLSLTMELPAGITYKPIDVGMPTIYWGTPAPFDGEWATYVYAFDTSLNPEWESIQMDLPPCTTLDQVVVDSQCIPEPATMGLIALGLAALVGRRRRGAE